MTTVLLAGILTAFVATTWAAGLRRAPTRVHCPRCGERTESVQLPPMMQRAAPALLGRWCPSCSWEGMGRQGAEVIPGKPHAHVSGFHWGSERLPEDFGFRFAQPQDESAPTTGEPPAHPSGFRFAQRPPHTDPSGFVWAGGEEARRPGVTNATPAPVVFRWADPAKAPAFVWRAPADRAPAFRWKD